MARLVGRVAPRRPRTGTPSSPPQRLPPWDPGLQIERTALAWRRTVVSGYGASLLIGRLLLDRSPAAAIALAACTTALVTAIAVRAALRHRAADSRLRLDEALPDARLFPVAAALIFLVGVMALVSIVLPA